VFPIFGGLLLSSKQSGASQKRRTEIIKGVLLFLPSILLLLVACLSIMIVCAKKRNRGSEKAGKVAIIQSSSILSLSYYHNSFLHIAPNIDHEYYFTATSYALAIRTASQFSMYGSHYGQQLARSLGLTENTATAR
jgi:hypothetical protein